MSQSFELEQLSPPAPESQRARLQATGAARLKTGRESVRLVPAAKAHQPAYADITQHEIEALKTRFNLADAHTHQRQSPTQRRIVEQLPSLWYEAEEGLQADFEQRFIDAFFRLQGQETARRKQKTMLAYAASISTVVLATYLAQRKLSVSLIEPCFDNLHDILKNMGVKLSPLPEQTLADPGQIYERLRRTVTTDAVFLVDPNNPTGFTLLQHGRKGFEEVVRYCKDHDKLFIVDLCFASFALMDERVGRFDLYELLESSGVRYIAIEDTGKVWPVQDAKCALLTVSDDIHDDVYNIHTSVLLNVSPFVLNMLSHYMEDSIRDGFASIKNVLAHNREQARRALEGSALKYLEPATGVSVAWFEIQRPGLTASRLQQILRGHEVYVLPGTYFYWSDPSKGDRYVRLALAREPRLIAGAVARLREALDRHA